MTSLVVTSSTLKTYMKLWGTAFKFWLCPCVRCQKDLLLSSETCNVFESDIPCFYPDLFMFRVFPFFKSDFLSFSGRSFPLFQIISSHFWAIPSHFWVSPSTFPNHSFPFFESDLTIFLGESLPLFQVSPSHFLSQTFPFIGSILLVFP